MAETLLVQRLDRLRSVLACQRAQQMTWRKIAAQFPGVPPGTLCAVYKGRMPRKPAILRALGLVGPEPWVREAARWLRARERKPLDG